ncbi:MAG: OmpL47-type beta-barrel domain-containing protein, partial [Methanomassiliicoccales archaeon]
QYRIDQGDWREYDGSFELGEGEHRLSFLSVDRLGNLEEENSTTVKVDLTPPEVSLECEGEGGDDWHRSEVRVNLSAEDSLSGVDSIQYRIDQGDWREYDGSFELPEGVHNVQYRVTDAAGNLENGSREIRVDSSSPEAEATVNGESEGHFTSDVEVRIEGSDEISGVDRIMYRLDGGEWSEYSAPIEVGDGEHTLEYRVMDAAGNLETGSAEFTVDTDPLSPSGPYGPLPIIGLVISIAAVIGAAVALRRK